jgi:hypothetical protein
LRDIGADEMERMERKRKKKNPDQGFAGNYKAFIIANSLV